MNIDLVNKFGYAEMYEWSSSADNIVNKLGRFVQFDYNEPDKINITNNPLEVIGISSINFSYLSDNDDKWKNKYNYNDVGDIILSEKHIAYGKREFDAKLNFPYISTHEAIAYEASENENFDSNKKYIKHSDRTNWSPITLLGKSIIYDYGSCDNQRYCQIYNGLDESLFGIAVPVYDESLPKYHIISRYSKNTIMILYK